MTITEVEDTVTELRTLSPNHVLESSFLPVSARQQGVELETFRSRVRRGGIQPAELPVALNKAAELAMTFAPIPSPQFTWSVFATFLGTFLVMVLFVVPMTVVYRFLETESVGSTVARGALSAVFTTMSVVVPIYCIFSPITSGRSWNWRFLLCIPISLSATFSFAFVPVGDTEKMFGPFIISGVVLSVVLCDSYCSSGCT